MAKQIACECGFVIRGATDDELWAVAAEHMRQAHPELAGKVTREDILSMAEEVA